MKRELLLITLAGATLFAHSQTNKDELERIHKSAPVTDTHTDTPMQIIQGEFDIDVRNTPPESRVDFVRLQEGDVDAIFFAAYTGQRKRTPENYDKAYHLAHQMIDSTIAVTNRNSDVAMLASAAKDRSKAEKKGKTAIYIGMENGFPIATDLSRIEEFYNRGVRYITLCHSSNNDICDSSTDSSGPEHDGVSPFGKKVISEMNRLGMIIDVSHVSDKSFFDIIECSEAPVIASHSSVDALCDHDRNMSDDMLKTLAQNGGVIQICILGNYIKTDTTSMNYIKKRELQEKYNNWEYKNEEEKRQARAEYRKVNKEYPKVLPTVSDAVDHIDHVVDLVGVDYVGIGSDFDGGGGLADCQDVSQFINITEELIKRGYSESDIHKIWGGNFTRVFKEVELIAKSKN